MWYAKRRSDGKEFLACAVFIKEDESGIFGVSSEGEKTNLPDGTFDFYKR